MISFWHYMRNNKLLMYKTLLKNTKIRGIKLCCCFLLLFDTITSITGQIQYTEKTIRPSFPIIVQTFTTPNQQLFFANKVPLFLSAFKFSNHFPKCNASVQWLFFSIDSVRKSSSFNHITLSIGKRKIASISRQIVIVDIVISRRI